MAGTIIWSPELSVGNTDIDLQHRKLLDTANMVHNLTGHESREIILAALDEVVQYTLNHFTFEETALLKAGYPNFDHHKQMHDTIRECVLTVAKNRSLVTAEMLDDVMIRLVEHITKNDKEYIGVI